MKRFLFDVREASKGILLGLFMPLIALVLTVELLWEWWIGRPDDSHLP